MYISFKSYWPKQLLTDLVRQYERADGRSRDHYTNDLLYHPMAEGKYLSTIAVMRRSGLLPHKAFVCKFTEACARLDASKTTPCGSRGIYGLGFAYKASDAEDKFLITNSVLMDGLLDSYMIQPNAQAEAIIKRILDWYTLLPKTNVPVDPKNDSHHMETVLVPVFSEQNDSLVANAVAHYVGTTRKAALAGLLEPQLLASLSELLPKLVRWIESHYTNTIGWQYSHASRRIDLLHQAYIINSLSGIESCRELRAVQMLCGFSSGQHFHDKLDIVSSQEAMQIMSKAKKTVARFSDTWALVIYPDGARAWSLGEALVTVGSFLEGGVFRGVWENFKKRILDEIKLRTTSEGASYWKNHFRSSMHVAHGLATCVSARNEKCKRGLSEIVYPCQQPKQVFTGFYDWNSYGVRDPVLLHTPTGEAVADAEGWKVLFNGRSAAISAGGTTAIGLAQLGQNGSVQVNPEPTLTDGLYAAIGSIVMDHDSSYRLFYSHDTKVGFRCAKSPNCRDWSVRPSVILTASRFGCARIGLPSVVFCGGRWVMLFEGLQNGVFRIFGAESNNLEQWKPISDGRPIFSPSTTSGWDSGGQANPSLARISDGANHFRWMFTYNGHRISEPSAWSIGCAELLDEETLAVAENTALLVSLHQKPFLGRGRLEGARLVLNNKHKIQKLIFFYLPTKDSYAGGSVYIANINIGDTL